MARDCDWFTLWTVPLDELFGSLRKLLSLARPVWKFELLLLLRPLVN